MYSDQASSPYTLWGTHIQTWLMQAPTQDFGFPFRAMDFQKSSLVPGLYLLFRVTRWIGARLINSQEGLGQWGGFFVMGVTP